MCSAASDEKMGPIYVIILFLASAAIGALCSLFIKEELRRLKPKEQQDGGQHIDTESSVANAF